MDYGAYLYNAIKTSEFDESERVTEAIDLRLIELSQLNKRLKALKYELSGERARILKQRKKAIKLDKTS
jgi:hypothetical protein